jgi:UDPglucose--hexose-1-phosphate uridylyltransferase
MLEFKKRIIRAEFESPFKSFEVVQAWGEVRTCPLSGHVTRLLPLRLKEIEPSDLSGLITRSQEMGCPFCPEAIEKKTSRFLPGFIPEGGRIVYEDTVIFPNAFPYDEYSAVAVVTKDHFLSPKEFTPRLLFQAFLASTIYFKRVKELMATARWAVLNWNYMPLAGAGMVHPHFQLTVFEEPTSYHGALMETQGRYRSTQARSIFDDLVAEEKKLEERYLFQTGSWHWLTAFAPRGLYEFWGLLEDDLDVLEMTEKTFEDLGAGISMLLKFFEKKGIQAFNMGLYSFYKPSPRGLRNMLSLVPRVNLPPMDTSDVNYFDRLHGESVTFVIPEEIAREARAFCSLS